MRDRDKKKMIIVLLTNNKNENWFIFYKIKLNGKRNYCCERWSCKIKKKREIGITDHNSHKHHVTKVGYILLFGLDE